jgi:predicted alpha/beta hydrolase family esterase
MKKAVLLHGTDGSPEYCWFPWLTKLLQVAGLETYVPLLPENHTPNRFLYDEFLQNSGWDFNDNLLIGHSSGATTVLNLLQSDWFPKVDSVVLVGTFLNENLVQNADWYEKGQFINLFPDVFDVEKIKSKANKFYFIHGDDDPYCDINDAKDLCKKIGGEFIVVPGGKHLSSNRTDLPEIIAPLKDKGLL